MTRTLTVLFAAALLAACGNPLDDLHQSTDGGCPVGETLDTSSGVAICVAACGNSVCTASQTCVDGVCKQSTCTQQCGAGQQCEAEADGGFACVFTTCSPACTTGQTCEQSGGTFACVQTDCFPACDTTFQECNKTAVPPVCVNTTCHPACATDEFCSQADGGFTCVALSTGTIQITAPDAGFLTGITTPLSVTANAGAPGGPTMVVFAVQQGSTNKAKLQVDVGNGGVYTGNIPLADAGLTSGSANVVGTVFWMLDGGELDASSPSVAITIDADPPKINGVESTDKTIYSGVATPAQTVHVTVPLLDTGASGINPTTVTATANGHTYSADTATLPDGGGNSGNYHFTVPASDLSSSTSFLGAVPYTVFATDKVGNKATLDGGSIALDNEAPTFDTLTFSATTWYGSSTPVPISVNVNDQVGGSGLLANSVTLTLSSGTTIQSPAVNVNTYSFSNAGSAYQTANQQGAIQFNINAQDNVGNASVLDGGSVLVDLKAPVVGATSIANGTAVAVNGWYAQNGGNIQVTTAVSDGTGSGPLSATLVVPGASGGALTLSASATTGSAIFTVPTTAQATGADTPLSMTASATDLVNNTSAASGTLDGAQNPIALKIDGRPPTVSAVSITTTTDAPSISSQKWFNQLVSTDIAVQATVIDGPGATDTGSGVDITTVQLVTPDGLTRIDYGTAVAQGSGVYTFKIKRSDGPIASNHQGSVSFKVAAKDNVGNATNLALQTAVTFGIDGQIPTAAFSVSTQYPIPNTGCSAANGGLTTTILCGHDGNRFTRNGDDGSALFFTGDDGSGGSGTATAGATCSMPGQTTCTATYNSGTSHYEFAINPSQATAFTSDADGRGTAIVTVTVRDAVGNTSTGVPATVNITRLKWIRSLPATFGALKVPTIVTPAIGGSRMLIVAGAGLGTGLTIGSLNLQGGVTSAVSTGIAATNTTNIAYSPATQTLYTSQEGAPKMVAFAASSTGLAAGYTCDLSTATLTGPPAILPGTAENVIVADTHGHKLLALNNTGDGSAGSTGCNFNNGGAPNVAIGTGALSSPTTDGTNVYAVYQNTGIAKVSFAAQAFGVATTKSLSFSAPLGGVAIATNLFADATGSAIESFTSDFTGTVTNLWSGSNGTVADPYNFMPVVNGGFVYGATNSANDGLGTLYAFNSATGAIAFDVQTNQSNSTVAIGADIAPVLYFTDDNGVVHARVRSIVTPTTTTLAPNWTAEFTGATTSATFMGLTNAPTLAADGTLYFGTPSGQVYAIATDSPGPVAPSTSNWPRVQFDNCNSSNSSLTNCQ